MKMNLKRILSLVQGGGFRKGRGMYSFLILNFWEVNNDMGN